MVIYINAENIDDRELKKAADILLGGGLVAFPTDTSWSIGASSLSPAGLEKLKKLKGGGTFTPTLFCSEISQVGSYVDLDNGAFRLIKRNTPGPFVFIFDPLHSVEKRLGMKRAELGIRIPDHNVPHALVSKLGHPIFAITASKLMTQSGWWDAEFAEENLFEYGCDLEDIAGVDLVLDAGDDLPKHLSTVVNLKNGEPEILRQGLGILE